MISSDRLRMCPPVPDDADDLCGLFADSDTYLIAMAKPHVPSSPDAIRARLKKYLDEESSPTADIALVVRTSHDPSEFLGIASVWGIDTYNSLAHLGIALAAKARRRGFGTEIITALRDYAFRVRNLRRLELETNATNDGVRRTAEKCGFVEEGRMRARHYDGDGYVDLVTYGMLREEWRRR